MIRSDQVIVMDAGTVAEIAPPSVLLARPDSAFSALVDRTGPAGAAALRKMAAGGSYSCLTAVFCLPPS